MTRVTEIDSRIPRANPPHVADEVRMLRSFLAYYRATIQRQADGLTAAQLAAAHAPSDLTLGGMLKHLAIVEHWWFVNVLEGRDGDPDWVPEGIWESDEDWDWHSAADDDAATLQARFEAAVAESDRITDAALGTDAGLDTLARRARHGSRTSLRWILVHLIEEYARHAGHGDLIREAVDGSKDL